MSLIFIQGKEEKNRKIHYEVDPQQPSLGEGGMGQVLRGVMVNEKNGVRQDVAIKFLFEDLPVHAIERARREASIQIHNENLVEMFGFIEVIDGNGTKRYHVVSELLQGVMLFDLLNGKTTDKYGNEIEFAQELYQQYQNDKFSFAVFIVKNILSGLMALHDKGYIHRDLDPSNIMITHDKKVKIIDFGIAKQLNSLNTQDQQLTSTGQFVGKAAYAAPELVLGDVRSQDKSTDIYAVGIMLYQFIVGSLPFEGTMAEIIKKQINEKLPLKNVPYKAIRRIIEKATAKKQQDRYQSASEMRVDLEHPLKPMNPHKGQHRSSTSGIWWLISALLLACLAGYLLIFQSSDEDKDRYEDRRESIEREKDRDENRDKDNQKAKEETDSTYQMEVSQAKQDSLQNLAKGKQATPKKEKKQKVSSRRTSGAAYSESSSQQRERSTMTTGTKNFGYATFRGALKNGMPHDVNGRLTFKTSHIIDSRDPKGRVAEPGDYVIGEFSDGHLVQGIWYGSDHQVKGSIIIGK